MDEVEQEGSYLLNIVKQYIFHPGVAGGIVGLGAPIDPTFRTSFLIFT